MITLTPTRQPQLWFAKTVKDDEGKLRVRLLDGQYAPLQDGGSSFEMADPKLNIQCDKEGRGTDEGVLFALKHLVKSGRANASPYYVSNKGKGELIALDKADTPADIQKAYRDWRDNGVIPRIKSTATAASSAGPAMKPKGGSLLADLLDRCPLPTPDKDYFYVDPIVWSRLLMGVEKGSNIMLVGDSGCGKTQITTVLSEKMQKELTFIDMGSKMDPIASLVGSHRVSPEKGSYFDRAKFTYAIEKPGVVVLDELSRAGALTNNILLPVLDWRKTLSMDLATNDQNAEIKVNPNCRFIATANIGFEYSGTSALDRALEERFQVIRMDYPPADIEAKLLVLKKNIKAKDADIIVKVANTIRQMARASELSKGVSLRHTQDCAELVEGGFDLKTALESSFLPYFQYQEAEKVLEVLSAR